MNVKKTVWWQHTAQKCAEILKTTLNNGLSTQEAQQRLKQIGFNELPKPKPISPFIIFLSQFSSFMVLVLIGILIITAFLGEWIDAAAIGAIVMLNALIGFFQEYSAERSLAALREMMYPTSRVMRDGTVHTIASRELVPGDLVILEAGDQVPADGRLIQALDLATQEAALTGESMPVSKQIDVLPEKELVLGDRKNMAFMGTIVVRGKGTYLVTETALTTELGTIASLLRVASEGPTPLQIRLEQLGHRLLLVCFCIIFIIFVLGVVRGTAIMPMILVALSLGVAAIPEGLPAVMTVALARGARNMAARNALIRRLSSVETLGSTTVICTDKTGTLTQNKMVVKKLLANENIISVTGIGYEPHGKFKLNEKIVDPHSIAELMLALKISVLCNNATIVQKDTTWHISGDPTEGALLVAAQKAGLEKKELEQHYPLVGEIPFSSERKRMSMVRNDNNKKILFSKGAPDIILDHATMILIKGKEYALTDEHKKNIMDVTKEFAQQALRILAVAYRNLDVGSSEQINESLENQLVFVGLLAMIDPPRPDAKTAIELCKKAGIKPIMITGDFKETAVAIAHELGLMEQDSRALSGTEFAQMSDEKLQQSIAQISVYSRVAPEHKIRIIKAWKARGDIVAMTGDGVNDAPAIKAADIGIAMGSGTEVTKEASDMIILDDNFASIINAVQEGRGIYDNTIKFVNYLLSSNIAELLIIFIGTFLGFTDPQGNPYISLLPVQLLWLNLITDGFPAVALAFDPLDPRAMDHPPRNPSEPILSWRFALQLFFIGVLLALGTLVACHYGLSTSASLGHTMTLTIFVMLELIRIQAIRRHYHSSLFANPLLAISLLVSFILQLMIIYIPAFQFIFRTVALGFADWLVMISIAIGIWVLTMVINRLMPKET